MGELCFEWPFTGWLLERQPPKQKSPCSCVLSLSTQWVPIHRGWVRLSPCLWGAHELSAVMDSILAVFLVGLPATTSYIRVVTP